MMGSASEFRVPASSPRRVGGADSLLLPRFGSPDAGGRGVMARMVGGG